MPKRNINLFTEDREIEYKVSDLFTEDELLDDSKCHEILTNQHYFDFEHKVSDKISKLFQYYGNIYCHDDFLYENKFKSAKEDFNGVSFLPILYSHIQKKYDFELLYENPKFTNHLFDEKEKTNKVSRKVSKPIIITNTKKHVWG